MRQVHKDQIDAVKTFADAMVSKLAVHAAKGDWRHVPVSALFSKFQDEVEEFKAALAHGNRVEILLEGADVANCIMMICDIVLGSPRPQEERERKDEDR